MSLHAVIKQLQDYNLSGDNDTSKNEILPPVLTKNTMLVCSSIGICDKYDRYQRVLQMIKNNPQFKNLYINELVETRTIIIRWLGTTYSLIIAFNIPNVYCQTIFKSFSYVSNFDQTKMGYTSQTGKGWDSIVEVCAEILRLNDLMLSNE
jgi:hypothetical protein